MTGFEPRTSGIGSNRSTNWATTIVFGVCFEMSEKCYMMLAVYITSLSGRRKSDQIRPNFAFWQHF